MNWKYYKRWNDIEEILAAFRRWKREDTEKNMKRIKAACITQTIHFINKDITKSEYSKRKVQEEITRYKHRLDRERMEPRSMPTMTALQVSCFILSPEPR